MTTRDEVMRHRRSGPWRALQQTAQVIVADAQRMGGRCMRDSAVVPG